MKTQAKSNALVGLLQLTEPELLRLMVEVNLSVVSAWCPRCRTFAIFEEKNKVNIRCPRCSGPRIVPDEKFWEIWSVRMKRALRKDPMLLPTVKAEWESIREGSPLLPSPSHPFPTPLAWLTTRWKEAGKPHGRPVQLGAHYRFDHRIQLLRDNGLPLKDIVALIAKERGKESAKDYATIEAEIRSTRRWVQDQRAHPQARLRGTRIKETRRSKRNAELPTTRSGATAQPTTRDQFRFTMVSLFVRQAGLTKREAVKRLAQFEGSSTSKEITQSLNLFKLANPRLYWRRGILRDKLNKMMTKD